MSNPNTYELAVYLVWPCKATSQWSKQNSSLEIPGLLVLAPWGMLPSLEQPPLQAV